ncbi:hypothetical protein BDV93DRAFT_606306 [Ceratobasidium sp. AG-I]|nr:hypothetical protein BDV93DRAFT_606306 [Ceratobasidium sp. AG-I]
MESMSHIVQHTTSSKRKPPLVRSSTFKPKLEPTVLHLTMGFLPNDLPKHGGAFILLPQVYDIFVSKAKLLEYTVASAAPAGHSKHVPWEEWGEYSTRWFHSAYVRPPAGSSWMAEGTRAIAANFLFPDGMGDNGFDSVTLLDFYPPTVKCSLNANDGHLSLWKSGPSRHVDLDTAEQDLADILETLKSNNHEGNIFVDVADENNPAFSTGFHGGTVVSRLPYRTVTLRVRRGREKKWTLDENKIVTVIQGQNQTLRVYTME